MICLPVATPSCIRVRQRGTVFDELNKTSSTIMTMFISHPLSKPLPVQKKHGFFFSWSFSLIIFTHAFWHKSCFTMRDRVVSMLFVKPLIWGLCYIDDMHIHKELLDQRLLTYRQNKTAHLYRLAALKIAFFFIIAVVLKAFPTEALRCHLHFYSTKSGISAKSSCGDPKICSS